MTHMDRRQFCCLAASGWLASLCGGLMAAGRSSPRFEKSISRSTLESYLSRAVTHAGLCNAGPEPRTGCLDDDLRMLTGIGARFIGRAAFSWTTPPDEDDHFRVTARAATKAHRADPNLLLEACIFEAVFADIERIRIPTWAFKAFDLPVEKRNFRYESMLYDGGHLRRQWGADGSVPDMTKIETRLWFYSRARRYIDAGCEALHLGQVHLMDHKDTGHKAWLDLLSRIRLYAAESARHRFVLCSAHTHGIAEEGRLLFDLHAYPIRPREVPGSPQRADLARGFSDSIYGKSLGGITPSGWRCDHLPYLVEVDNWGSGGKAGKPGAGFPWVWGYDEISWLAHQTESYRREWLQYAWDWVRKNDPNGYVQMPTRRMLADPVGKVFMFHANRKSQACPTGFGLEDTIREIWPDA